MATDRQQLENGWFEQHRRALTEGADHYIDSETGYLVFSEAYHQRRGYCCGASCRHCPYAHEAVDPARRRPRTAGPSIFPGTTPSGLKVDVIFWSGGKDAWLAWDTSRSAGRASVWLTTFDPERGMAPVQEVSVATLLGQARRAGQTLVLVPVGGGRGYDEAVLSGLDAVGRSHQVARLLFGDLWLDDVRRARERALGDWAARQAVELAFPLWQVPRERLLSRLFDGGPGVRISASRHPAVRVGDRYDRAFVERLPPDVDPMGERGEFHTLVEL